MTKSTILVVDDEAFFRQLYAELLVDADYRVETATSGDEALTRLRQGGVDIVLTDLVMPGLDGLALLRESRNVENPPDVILVTGHATVETAIQALKDGARDYLLKPFNPNELLHLVRTCLEQRKLLDENLNLKNQIRLFRAGQTLASILDVETLLSQTLSTALRELRGGRGLAFLLGRSGAPDVLVRHGIDVEHAEAVVPALQGQGQHLSGLGKIHLEDLQVSKALRFRCGEILLYPLRSQDETKGYLALMSSQEGGFPKPAEIKNVLFLLEQASLGFENCYRYLDARELIYTDDLTSLYNYRYLHLAMDQEIARGSRYGFKFSIIFIDLDHFKDINDTYGHLVGSNTLKVVADLLRKCVREVDILFRYGGDEFTALLVETDKRGAAIVAERIRRTIAAHQFTFSDDISFRLTSTVGHATFPDNAKDRDPLIDMADRAMYLGKELRNVTRSASDL